MQKAEATEADDTIVTSSTMSLSHGGTEMRLARDFTRNDRLLGQELAESFSKERKQVRYGILLLVYHCLIATSSV